MSVRPHRLVVVSSASLSCRVCGRFSVCSLCPLLIEVLASPAMTVDASFSSAIVSILPRMVWQSSVVRCVRVENCNVFPEDCATAVFMPDAFP